MDDVEEVDLLTPAIEAAEDVLANADGQEQVQVSAEHLRALTCAGRLLIMVYDDADDGMLDGVDHAWMTAVDALVLGEE